MARRYLVAMTVALVLAASDVAEGQADGKAKAPSVRITAGEVEITGQTAVKSASNIKSIGQGHVQIRDKNMKTAVLIGTSSVGGSGPAQRLQPIEGSGIALTNQGDKGGVFVSASLGRVGINDASGNYESNLHIKGGLTSDRLVAPYSGKKGPSMLLDAIHHNTVLLGKPAAPKLKYSIGRGKVVDREMTFSTPNVAEYDGAGKSPITVFQSPDKVLAAVTAGKGDVYVAGNMGVSAQAETAVWKSGSASNMHVFGEIRMEEKSSSKTQANGVALYYRSTGRVPAMSFRTGAPTAATPIDTKLFISGTKKEVRVGVNTRTPKTHLDVRGHINMESDNNAAGFYYPSSTKGKAGGFFIRGSEAPSPGTDAAASTRFYIAPDGKTGINTITPEHGLCLMGKAGTELGNDASIPKGNLHLKGGVHDMDKVHKLTLDDENVFKAMNVETGFTVGAGAKAHEGKNSQVHIRGAQLPKLMISHAQSKPVTTVLQTGVFSWNMESTSTNFNIVSSKATQEKVYFSKGGNMVVGSFTPKFGLQIESKNALEHPANDLYITKGNVLIKSGIRQKAKYKEKDITWALDPQGFSNLKDLACDGNMAVGTYKRKHQAMYVEKHRTGNIGDAGFLFSTGQMGTVSFNEHLVTIEGQTVKKLHDKKAYAAAVRFGSSGTVDFEGTAQLGNIKMGKLMSLNAPANKVTFEKYSDFGMNGAGSIKFPLRVKGGSREQQSTVAFGHMSNSMGRLGANSKMVFLANYNEKHFLAAQHNNGHVGIGTTTATEELTIRTEKANSDIHFTSNKASGKLATLTMEAGGSTKIHASAGDVKSGKFEVKEFTNLAFTNDKSKAKTIFDRGNPPVGSKPGDKFKMPWVQFRTGKVGLSVSKPQHHLHIGGDHWSQGQLILKKGFARSESEMMEFSDLIQMGEGVGHTRDGTDVADAVAALARLVRRNKQRLAKQRSSITQMEAMLK